MVDGDQGQQQQQDGGQQQQQQAPWHQGIEAETIGFLQNKGIKLDDPKAAIASVTKFYREAEKHLGVPADQLMRWPKDAADEANWKALNTRLGVPGDAKEYSFEGVKFEDGTDLEAGFTDTMRAALLAAAVPKERAPTVVKAVVKYLEDADKAEAADAQTKLAEEKGKLAKSWGTNYEFNRLKAMEGARRLGIDPEAVALLEKQVGYSKVMEAMRRVGVGTSEDTWKDGERQAGGPMTREQAMARKTELMRDAAWVKRYQAGGATEAREMMNISQIIAGQTLADIKAA